MVSFVVVAVLIVATCHLSAGDNSVERGDKPIYPVPTSCPAVDPIDSTVRIAHLYDCTWFYTCDNGRKVMTRCPAGTHFNRVLQVCDWPYRANCPNAFRIPEKDNSEKQDRRAPECPMPDGAFPVYLPHPRNCHKFYECSNGEKYLFRCPSDLVFNTHINVCDWEWNFKCSGGGSTPKPSTTPEPSTTPKPTTTTTPPTTPTPPPTMTCPFPDPITYSIYFPHPTDCNLFYQCSNGTPILQKCPPGLHFNRWLNVCDYPVDAKC